MESRVFEVMWFSVERRDQRCFFSHCKGSTAAPSTRNSKYSAGLPAGFRPTGPTAACGVERWPRAAPRAQVAIQRIGPCAVVNDDEIAVASNWSANATVPSWTLRTGGPSAAPISMPFLTMAVPKRLLGWRPKGRSTGPRAGHGRSPWNGRRASAGAAARPPPNLRDRGLQLLLRGLELPGQLAFRSRRASIESTSAVRAATARSAAARARAASPLSASSSFGALLQRLALARQGIQRRVVLVHARSIDGVERRDGSIRAAHRVEIVDAQQQAPVSGAAHLVQLHKAGLDVRQLRRSGLGERGGLGLGRVQLALHVHALALDLRQLLDGDLSLELQPAEVGEQRALLGRERISLLRSVRRRSSARLAAAAARSRSWGAGVCPESPEGTSGTAASASAVSATRIVHPVRWRALVRSTSKHRLAIDIGGNLHPEVLQHGRRDVHDRRRARGQPAGWR